MRHATHMYYLWAPQVPTCWQLQGLPVVQDNKGIFVCLPGADSADMDVDI